MIVAPVTFAPAGATPPSADFWFYKANENTTESWYCSDMLNASIYLAASSEIAQNEQIQIILCMCKVIWAFALHSYIRAFALHSYIV